MAVFESLHISDDVRNAIANGIFTAITNDIPEIIQEHNLTTSFGAGHFRWNYIIRNVRNNLEGCLQLDVVKRGAFPLLLIYDKSTGFTFSIMAERNLSKLQRRLPNVIHYLESLIMNNAGYEAIEGQIRLEDVMKIERNQTAIENLRNQLLSSFSGIIKNHILITFEYSFFRVISASAVLLTPELEIAFKEDWSHFLNKQYIVGKNSLIAEMNEQDSEEPLVRIKKTTAERQSEKLVSLAVNSAAIND
jgi:hypothetical protein